jgi:biotin carboxyl carrier protein
MKYIVAVDGTDYPIEIQPTGKPGGYTVSVEGRSREVDLERTARGWLYSLLLDGRSFEIAQAEGELEVNGRAFAVEIERGFVPQRARGGPATAGQSQLKAPIPGLVIAVQVQPGDQVEAGQAMVIVEAMKMQMELKSPRAGRVAEVNVLPGQEVNRGQVLAQIGDAI